MQRLDGRCGLVSGAGGGIGRATALRLAEEGARVVVTDIDHDALAETTSILASEGHAATGFVADVTDPESVAALISDARGHLGFIDILVNCAGIVHDEPVSSMDPQAWNRVLDTNLTSVFLMCREVVPDMTNAGYGRIINVASQLALNGAIDHSAYAASKAGVIAFTKSLGREVSPWGVTANCVAPGPIDTPMLKRDGLGWTAERIEGLPIRRIGQPSEVAGTVAFLASERDGALYTGQVLGPNSGDVM
jgi:3-oxoacyl-[acyl-carrier protein] reductase